MVFRQNFIAFNTIIDKTSFNKQYIHFTYIKLRLLIKVFK